MACSRSRSCTPQHPVRKRRGPHTKSTTKFLHLRYLLNSFHVRGTSCHSAASPPSSRRHDSTRCPGGGIGSCNGFMGSTAHRSFIGPTSVTRPRYRRRLGLSLPEQPRGDQERWQQEHPTLGPTVERYPVQLRLAVRSRPASTALWTARLYGKATSCSRSFLHSEILRDLLDEFR